MGKTVVITEQGTVVGVKGGLLVLKSGNEIIQTFKPFEVDQLILMGGVDFTNKAATLILKHGIDLVLMTKAGSYKGRLVSHPSKNVLLRVAQFETFRDRKKATEIAAAIVEAKIKNQRNLLLRAQRDLQSQELEKVLVRMRSIVNELKDAQDVDTVRGLEGEAARLYFANFGKLIRNPLFHFSGRNRRPPRDPINACLSFGYTLLGTVVEHIVNEVGFDPYLGVLHEPVYGRASLVLDLMEEFRPIVVDALTLGLINLKQLNPTDFGPPEGKAFEEMQEEDPLVQDIVGLKGAVYLKGEGTKVFIGAFLRRLRSKVIYPGTGQRLSLQQIIRQQAYLMARVVKGDVQGYNGFVKR